MPSIEMDASKNPATSNDLDIVLESLADIVEVPQDTIDPTAVLTTLGIDSYTAVRLRRRLSEDTNVDLELTAFLGDSTAQSIAEQIATTRVVDGTSATPDEPSESGCDATYSITRGSHTFELSAVQQAYLVGREPAFPLGGVATYYYFEFDRALESSTPADPLDDLRQLELAWNDVVQRHPMLRFVVTDDARGTVRDEVPRYSFAVTDLRHAEADVRDDILAELRRTSSHRVLPVDTGPLFDIRAALLPGAITRLFVGFDVLALDMTGCNALMREWGSRVSGRTDFPPLGPSFHELVHARANDPEHQRRRRTDLEYWRTRMDTLPAGPALRWTTPPADLGVPRFTRYATTLTPAQWVSLQAGAATRGVTPTAVLLAAFATTLHCWGATERFALNTTLFDREPSERSDSGNADPTVDSVGDFTNTALVEIPDHRDQDFATFAAAVNHRFWSDIDHRTVSGVESARLGRSTEAGRVATPTHPVVFTSGLGLSEDTESPTHWLGTEIYGVSQTPQVLLDHIVRDHGGAVNIAWDTVVGALDPQFVRAMAEAHIRLLRRLADEPLLWSDPTIGHDPSFLPPDPVTPSAFDDEGPLLTDPFDGRCRRDASAPAIVVGRSIHTADQIYSRSTRCAEVLAAQGIGPGSIVAVCADKSAAQVTALLGVAGSGATYVPVEPSWPAERIASVVRQGGIEYAVISTECDPAMWPASVTALVLDADGSLDGPRATPRRPAPDDLAYIIFTSGSTGEPKGVAIEHRAARTTLDDLMGRFPLTADDRVLALSAFSFDLSVFDIFSVLGAGGALVLPDSARLRDPGHWMDVMSRHHVTLWNTAPALLEMLVEYAEIEPDRARRAFASVRLVFLSGDYIPTTLPDRFRALAPHATVVSLGGATEASIWSIFHPIDTVDPEWTTIPYGRALGGQSFHILDDSGTPCAVGEAGELHIGGDGLAREYIGNPEQTTERFFRHEPTGLRLYRTGDLGRWRPDGAIEFLGRVDRQVKIAGHRIELGEIDTTLERLSGVRAAVAAAVPGPDDRPRLVCYIVDAIPGEPDSDAELAAALRRHLPPYMIPGRFVRLAQLPVTANGKVDHRALPNPFHPSTTDDPAPSARAAESDIVDGSGDSADTLDIVSEALHRGLDVSVTVTAGRLAPRSSLDAAAQWATAVIDGTGDSMDVTEVHATQGLLELRFSADTASPTPESPATAAPVPTSSPEAPATVIATTPSGPVDPEIERMVSAVFTDLLGPDVPGPDTAVDRSTPFFDLGATSLTLVLAHRRLSKRFDRSEFTVIDLFANATVAALSAFLSDLERTVHNPIPVTVARTVPDPGASPDPGLESVASRQDARRAARRQAAEVAG